MRCPCQATLSYKARGAPHSRRDEKNRTAPPAFTPVPRQRSRHDGWSAERQHGFIEALADYGSVRAAANAVGMTPESAYYLRRQPAAEEFAAAWAAALDHGIRRIEDVAMDRALNGVEVPVYSYGKLVGTRRIYNDRLLMFMLRNRAPQRFAEGSASAMNALDRHRLARMKREWRAEWDAEHAARNGSDEQASIDSIKVKIGLMHQRNMNAMSPRARAAYEAWQAAQAEDRAKGSTWLDGDESGDDQSLASAESEPKAETSKGQLPARPDPGLDPGEQEERDGLRRLKDEGWD